MFRSGAIFQSVSARLEAWIRAAVQDGDASRPGYVAVDALVALMILSSVLICAMAAAHQSTKAAEVAFETRRANDLIGFLLETSPAQTGEGSGSLDGFLWRRSVSEPFLAFGPGSVCIHAVDLVSQKSHRSYAAQTSVVCESAKPA